MLLFMNWLTINIVYSKPPRLMEESPRWLLSRGRIEETKTFVLKAAKSNKVQISTVDLKDLAPDRTAQQGRIWHLFSYKVLRYKTFVIFFNWQVLFFVASVKS